MTQQIVRVNVDKYIILLITYSGTTVLKSTDFYHRTNKYTVNAFLLVIACSSFHEMAAKFSSSYHRYSNKASSIIPLAITINLMALVWTCSLRGCWLAVVSSWHQVKLSVQSCMCACMYISVTKQNKNTICSTSPHRALLNGNFRCIKL